MTRGSFQAVQSLHSSQICSRWCERAIWWKSYDVWFVRRGGNVDLLIAFQKSHGVGVRCNRTAVAIKQRNSSWDMTVVVKVSHHLVQSFSSPQTHSMTLPICLKRAGLSHGTRVFLQATSSCNCESNKIIHTPKIIDEIATTHITAINDRLQSSVTRNNDVHNDGQ